LTVGVTFSELDQSISGPHASGVRCCASSDISAVSCSCKCRRPAGSTTATAAARAPTAITARSKLPGYAIVVNDFIPPSMWRAMRFPGIRSQLPARRPAIARSAPVRLWQANGQEERVMYCRMLCSDVNPVAYLRAICISTCHMARRYATGLTCAPPHHWAMKAV
jgi:hypothetical protein